MKTQKLLFNHLLRRYNKSIRRVTRLIELGKNKRRQLLLQKQIGRLFDQLTGLQLYLKRGVVLASVAVATIAFDSQAQNFAAPQSDPFGLSFPGIYLSNATFADLDNDGDMDMLSGEFGYYSGSANFIYYENTGTASVPDFGSLISNPFGMSSGGDNLTRPTFVDLDDDGDMDVISGTYYGEFLYLENVGTSSSPSFAAPVLSPFGLTAVGANFACPAFADVDGDGDFDLLAGSSSYLAQGFSYQENIGTAVLPSFDAPQVNPFGLVSVGSVLTAGFTDIDNDGDLDILAGGNMYSFGVYGGFTYYENIGDSLLPNFGTNQLNPFNIQASGENWGAVGFIDLNDDGLVDFMSGSIYGEFFYYEQNCAIEANALPACGGGDGSVSTAVMTPNGIDTYVWSNGATTPMISGLSPGTYMVTVTSSSGCSLIDTAVVEGLNSVPLQSAVSSMDISCNGETDGVIYSVVIYGNTPYSYAWSNGNSQEISSGLAAGPYTLTLTDACGTVKVHVDTIIEPAALSITMSSTDESGPGNYDGQAIAIVSGGTAPYPLYSWSDGSSNDTLSNITSGIYTVYIEDDNRCEIEGSVTVSSVGCNLSVTTSVVDPDFCGNGRGSASASATGGTSPYYYDWNGGWGSSDTVNSLYFDDAYIVTVYDDIGCVGFASITMTGGEGITNVQISAVDPSCGSNNGVASVVVMGGATPLSYTWFDFNQNLLGTGSSVTNLSVGVIGVEVEDANGCYDDDFELLSNPGAPSFNVEVEDESCQGTLDGSIVLDAIGGTSPYVYSWMNLDNGVITTGVTSMNGLSGGTSFLLTVADASVPACIATSFANVEGGDSMYVDLWSNTPYCFGGSDGSIIANTWGGNWPYSYSWDNGATSDYVTGLAAGTYNVTVTDDNGCIGINSVAVVDAQENLLTVIVNDATCGNSDGDASVSASTGAMNYFWSDGQTSSNAINLAAGIYDVTVEDWSGCMSLPASFVVSNSNGPTITVTSNDVSCNGDADGDIVVIAGGTSYTYTWSNGPITANQSGLSGGTYTLTVSDSGCDGYASVDISENDAVFVTITTTDETSAGADDGTALAVGSGGDGNLTYDWGSAGSNDYIFGLSAGSYTVTVTDGSGCVATATAIVSEPLSIGELDNSIELLLYPNPNNGTFVVSISKEGNYNVVVRNVIGQTKENVDLNGTNKEISLNSIEAGIYFVTIKSEGFEKTEKIIVR